MVTTSVKRDSLRPRHPLPPLVEMDPHLGRGGNTRTTVIHLGTERIRGQRSAHFIVTTNRHQSSYCGGIFRYGTRDLGHLCKTIHRFYLNSND